MRVSEVKFPTLIGLLLAIGGLVSGLWLVQGQLSKTASAAADETPKEVRISNITDVSFVVSWVTDKETLGFVQYGEGNASEDIVVTDDRDQLKGTVQEYYTHLVTIKGLKAESAYQFKLGSNKKMFDSNGSAYKASTGPRIDTEPPADVAYGQAVNSNGEPAEGALVYLQLPGGVLQTALVKASGSWVIPLSTIRSTDLKSYLVYDKLNTKIEISVNGGILTGKSLVEVSTKNDNPVPEIILGRDYNYLIAGNTIGNITDSTSSSKLTPPTPTTIPDDLNVLTPKLDEKINSASPEIIGVAPAGTEVTIEIHSTTPIVGKVTAGSDGKFSYSVPSGLTSGEHTLTISAIIDGAVKTITRSFTVYAAGDSFDPAFSATPSASPSPLPSGKPTPTTKPTATPRPTATPKPTPTSKPTQTPTPLPTLIPTSGPTPINTPIPTVTTKPTPTPKPTPITTVKPTPTPTTSMPKSGGGDQSLAMILIGLLLTGTGWWWYRKAV